MIEILSAAAIIPARYGSTRFPGKPLALLAGRPMIQHVYNRVGRARRVRLVIVATDDRRILKAVEAFGGTAVITSGEHATGTDRVAEVAAGLEEDIIIDVQGDEPLILPQAVDAAIEPFLHDPELQMTTLAHRLDDAAELEDPDVVKVVCDGEGYAADFFRRPGSGSGLSVSTTLPGGPAPAADADAESQGWSAGAASGTRGKEVLRHVGLYGFRRAYLLQLAAMEPTRREREMSLEQLRPLESGCRIRVIKTDYRIVGVDRPEDIAKAERLLLAEQEAWS